MTNKSNNLVIVESPAKARTIGNMLGGGYSIMASMGHIRDLPQHTLGVDIKNKFKPEYVVSRADVAKKLSTAATHASNIYLATDPDREGEAIAWHLKEILSQKGKPNFYRVEFHEITKSAIAKAFKDTRDINFYLVDAQQARRVLDRLVGYQVSPLLWPRIKRNISAGRVQSVALRIICEREREIQNFQKKEYWDFYASLLHNNDSSREFESKLIFINGKKVDISSSAASEKAFADINETKILIVKDAKTEPVKKASPPPFITSTMQQAAGSYLRFSAGKTMQIAQQLYEGIDIGSNEVVGLITYMRTDSFTISKEAQNDCANYIKGTYGEKFVPDKPNFYKNKSSSQEAHEAIRPTDVTRTPEVMSAVLSKDQLNLYRLIWKRFVASQMAKAELIRTTLDLETSKNQNTYTFRTTSSSMLFPGFTILSSDKNIESKEEAEKIYNFLKEIAIGDKCNIKELKKEQKFTEPPPRYTEPTLIKELEANGIGRPSTYAAIVNTIQQRKYVLKKEGKLVPEELGFKVNDFLVSIMPDLVNITFTAEMEEKLDKVEDGTLNWTEMIETFFNELQTWLNHAKYDSAPDKEKTEAIIELMKKISNWAPPEKVGKRTFNDKYFFNSVLTQYNNNKILSSRQWESLLKIFLKYYSTEDEIVKEYSEKYNLKEDLGKIKATILEAKEQKEKFNEQRNEVLNDLKVVINKIHESKLNLVENEKFNESNFVNSLKEQIDAGKILSSKQLYVLKRIVIKNKENIQDYNTVATILKISEKDVATAAKIKAMSEIPKENISEMLNFLDSVTSWVKNEKNPKLDDKKFYLSLKTQFEQKQSLSVKQISALKRLTEKYK